jgi:hypothetical protein
MLRVILHLFELKEITLNGRRLLKLKKKRYNVKSQEGLNVESEMQKFKEQLKYLT